MRNSKPIVSACVAAAVALLTSCGGTPTVASTGASTGAAGSDGQDAHHAARFGLLRTNPVCEESCNAAEGTGLYGPPFSPFDFRVVDSTLGDSGFVTVVIGGQAYLGDSPNVTINGTTIDIVDNVGNPTVATVVIHLELVVGGVNSITIEGTPFEVFDLGTNIIRGSCVIPPPRENGG